ncbi:MAG: leucine-rich repeat domain-containing protein, partial [Clostridia bacterium]|nr:leucine-rich repeat domain-containing protein [Clostridia bacterium]
RNKGISLIVLIITIIVMIILAGSIILTLNNSGIIQKASEAVETANLKEVKNIAEMAWGDAYANGARKQSELEKAVMDALKANNITEAHYKGYIIKVTTEGVEFIPSSLFNHSGIIPEGATYKSTDGTEYNAGDEFPNIMFDGDIYTYNGYEYTLSVKGENGMSVIGSLEDMREFFKSAMEAQEGIVWADILKKYNITEEQAWESVGLTDKYVPATGEWAVETTDANDVLTSINNVPVVATVIITLPEGATYYSGGLSGTAMNKFPETMKNGDVYTYGDYKYTYQVTYQGKYWNVVAVDKTKTSYGTILENINDVPVTSMTNTFSGCTALTDLSKIVIPSSVTSMTSTFSGCTALTDISKLVIPSSVTSMGGTFSECTALTDASNFVIPSNVSGIGSLFSGCTNLKTAPIIPATVKNMNYLFENCESLTGTITINVDLGKTYISHKYDELGGPVIYSMSSAYIGMFNGTKQAITLTSDNNVPVETLLHYAAMKKGGGAIKSNIKISEEVMTNKGVAEVNVFLIGWCNSAEECNDSGSTQYGGLDPCVNGADEVHIIYSFVSGDTVPLVDGLRVAHNYYYEYSSKDNCWYYSQRCEQCGGECTDESIPPLESICGVPTKAK